jgi:putative ATP-binding cassette transporter
VLGRNEVPLRHPKRIFSMHPVNRSLWLRFIAIAQPYFFPTIRGGRWVTFLLMVMLLLFLFGVLSVVVTGMILVENYFAPVITSEIASGLLTVITDALHSDAWLIVAAALIIPATVFVAFGRHLRKHKQAWFLLALVLILSLSVTGINVAFSYISNYFTNALVKKNQDMAYLFVAVYFCGFLVGIPVVAFYSYGQNYLGMRWREWMTGSFLSNYFKNRRYYEIEAASQIDNPDQRIMEDIRSFTRTSLTFLLVILGSFMDLVSFTGILWSKSILLVCVVLGYSLTGTALTVLIGRRLVGLNFNQLRYEADFRYSLVHARDNAESIAFYQGEKPEVARISGRFRSVLRNFSFLIGWQRNLSFFTTAYSYLPVVLPFLVLFPQYFGGQIEYGDMVQANFAFTQVYAALSLIVSQIEQLTNFAAGVDRLSTFGDAINPERVVLPGIKSRDSDQFAMTRMTLLTPNRTRTLIRDLTMELEKNDNLVVVGQSGVGKSSLLRAIAGLWTQGAGIVRRPPLSKIFFLPQKPYMLLGSLRDQLLYPRLDGNIPDVELEKVLKTVRLEDLPERVGGFDAELDWADVLSLGEQQRLAFARLLLNKPGFAVLDEATSALDIQNEANLYRKLRELDIHYISVGHRSSILEYHDHVLDLQGPERWRLLPVKEYQMELAFDKAQPAVVRG